MSESDLSVIRAFLEETTGVAAARPVGKPSKTVDTTHKWPGFDKKLACMGCGVSRDELDALHKAHCLNPTVISPPPIFTCHGRLLVEEAEKKKKQIEEGLSALARGEAATVMSLLAPQGPPPKTWGGIDTKHNFASFSTHSECSGCGTTKGALSALWNAHVNNLGSGLLVPPIHVPSVFECSGALAQRREEEQRAKVAAAVKKLAEAGARRERQL